MAILFKLAMYLQPFLWGMLVVLLLHYAKKKYYGYALLLTLGIFNYHTTQNYLNLSLDTQKSHLPYVSTKIYTDKLIKTDVLLSDTPSIVLAKVEALQFRGHSLFFPSRDYFENVGNVSPNLYHLFNKLYPNIQPTNQTFKQQANTLYQTQCFNTWPEDTTHPKCNHFQQLNPKCQESANILIQSSPEQSILNRWNQKPFPHHEPTQLTSLNQIKNHLIFIDSKFGEHYYLPFDQDNISLYMLEQDYFYPKQTFSAINRYFLFEVLNPVSQSRLALNITTTLNADSKNALPQVIMIGQERIKLPLVGHGSARVFSSIITPQNINGQYFIMLDTQGTGKYFQGAPRSKLMKIYGTQVLMDRRAFTGFGRDISLVSEEQYQQIKAPSLIKKFPDDLNNPNLEYSGFYEDGWVGDEAYVYLTPNTMTNSFILQGNTSNDFSTILIIKVDNKNIYKKKLTYGNFKVKIPIHIGIHRRHCIKLQLSKIKALSATDKRPVSIKIQSIGFLTNNNILR